MGIKLANNAVTALAAGIGTSDVTVSVYAGTGALFPALSAGDYFYAAIEDASNNYEIVKVTARAGDAMTIVRAQEGTAALSFPAGAAFDLRMTQQTFFDYILETVGSAAIDEFTGDGGTTYGPLTYTPTDIQQAIVFAGGVPQRPTTDYSFVGDDIVFTSNQPIGRHLMVCMFAPASVLVGALVASNNLSDVANVATARANLGVIGSTDTATLTNKTIAAATNVVEARSGPNTSPFSHRNKIINGNFDIWQRATSQTTGGYGSADRWYISLTNTTASRGSLGGYNNGASGKYCLYIVPSNATNSWQFDQSLSSEKCDGLKGKTVTLSIYAWCGSGTVSATLFASRNGTADVRTTGSWTNIDTKAITLTTTPQRFTLTVSIPNDTTANGLLFGVAGSNTPNGVVAAFWGFQAEEGSVATPVEMPPIEYTTALCLPYYQTGSFAKGGASYSSLAGAWDAAEAALYPMRYTPTVVLSNLTYIGCSSATPSYVSSNGFSVSVTTTGATTYALTSGTFTADAEIK